MKDRSRWWFCFENPNRPELGIMIQPSLETPESAARRAAMYTIQNRTMVFYTNSPNIPSVIEVVCNLQPVQMKTK